MTIALVDTSIGDGNGAPAGLSYRERLQTRTGLTIVNYSLGGGQWTHDNPGTTDNLRKHLDLAVATHPDVVQIGGPVNDCVNQLDTRPIREAVQAGITAALAGGVRRVVLHGIYPLTDGPAPYALQPGWWPRLEQMRADYNAWAAQAGATEAGVAYAGDCGAYLAAPGGTRGDVRWFADGLHPNRFGTSLIAEAYPVELLTL